MVLDLRKILHGGHKMAKLWNGKDILLKVSTPWVRYRRQTATVN